jgi:hypothetical protein
MKSEGRGGRCALKSRADSESGLGKTRGHFASAQFRVLPDSRFDPKFLFGLKQ